MKDYLRDYATEAFRFYASVNMSADQYKELIRKEALENIMRKMGVPSSSGGSPTESQLMYAEEQVMERISEIEDLEAVEKTMAEFSIILGKEIYLLIKIVYFKDPNKLLEKGEIKDRILIAMDTLHISESTAYRYLKRARLAFAFNRGLRIKRFNLKS